jgi:ATPase subunit of ABC transporter with duplicated ATPase domains
LTPAPRDIGYLDQHYQQIDPKKTVIEVIQECQPAWSHNQLRIHLNDFLFRKNEQVYSLVDVLSGGEKARLILAKIAANPPKLLILDEVTNNLDLKTRNHVIKVVQNYPGALIVISHDEDFLQNSALNEVYTILENTSEVP